MNLILGFLEARAWQHAQQLLMRLAPLEPAASPVIGQALRSELRRLLDTPAEVQPMEEGEASTDSELLAEPTFEVLCVLGLWIHKDIVLFTQLCRKLRGHLLAAGIPETGLESSGATPLMLEAIAQVEGAMEAAILPALTLLSANPAAVNEVYSVLGLLPYTARFRLYSTWKDAINGRNPMLAAQRQLTVQEVRRIMRRLSKENVKEFGRKLGKVAHGDPLTVFSTILGQIEVYNNMIQPVVDAFKYLTSMGYDVLTYSVIVNLAQSNSSRNKLKEDGMNVSLWLQSLAAFCGHVTRKYPAFHLTALMQLLCNQLKNNQSIDLLVLKEVLAKMTGVEVLSDLSDDQVAAMAGGEQLRTEALTFTMTGSAKSLQKGAARLKDALMSKDDPMAVPFLVLIGQQRTSILFNTDTPHLKLVRPDTRCPR
ncbi:hypothetical protein CYMTET_33047 [Cymbomonas tetramitiformis]|uniref:THO complex subunit 2 n=1 Tax=Cymbomonas tetramitiformis TaxID=36881 RepID=A0AAE0KR93_9CHLO|nr:hypothetical protein CYMTET_33047 [Cymbomonas tetramitiformis]